MHSAAPATARNDTPPAWQAVAGVALAYAGTGWLALLLAVPPGYAAPLFPSAGLALAAVLVYGRRALAGVALGSAAVNLVLASVRGGLDDPALGLPLVIGLGAALQAGAGALLVRRFVPGPLVLTEPREILTAGLLGGFLACCVSPSVATAALLGFGAIDRSLVSATWGTWWVGDTLGVLIGAPLVLTLIGRPRGAWRPRRVGVAVPLAAATLLLAGATLIVSRAEEARLVDAFGHDAEALLGQAAERLRKPQHALQALHSAHQARGGLDGPTLRDAAAWWLGQPIELQAAGVSLRVPRAGVAAFEARAHEEDAPGYRVFERDAALAAADPDVLPIRWIAPLAGNTGALGVNTFSIAAARQAVLRARDDAAQVATAGFRLTQSTVDETGIVIYQPLYTGVPTDAASRQRQFAGVLFVTVRAERLLGQLARPDQPHLRWCLVDADAAAPRRRLAGPAGCEAGLAGDLQYVGTLPLATRTLELRVASALREAPGRSTTYAWFFAVTSLLAGAMLGALLLNITGRSRRVELAVEERTAELQREVQERSRAEEALREGQARLRSILDHVPIGVLFLDRDGRIVETNPHLCRMLGRDPAQLRGQPLWSLAADATRSGLRELLAGLLDGAAASPGDAALDGAAATDARQLQLLRGDGQPLWVRTLLAPLRDERGRTLRVAGVVEDITEHLRLEESERALDRAEAASRAKSEFVSRMSHELRTPLNAMIGFAQLLSMEREGSLGPRQLEWTGQIQRAGWHLLEMINDTLDLARVESGAVALAHEPLDLRAVVTASLAMVGNVADKRRVAVHAEFSAAAAGVLGDATRVQQVLTNLLSNAVKYNREGGSVVVATGLDADGHVQVAVRDTGLGMTPEQMASLFQPYNRLGRESGPVEGTGIGLVISRRLAELMGGSLEVASVAGQGSVFTLRLPRAVAPVAAASPGSAASSPARVRARTVHYVEDNATNVEVMRGVIAQRPALRLSVSTLGLDAIAEIRRERPDLVLLDMHLPDISGLELLRHLKNDPDLTHLPVIVVSADATTARIEEALTLGAAHYLTKPLDIAAFLRTLDDALDATVTR